MLCHNGSPHDDYAGPGMENPHPFGTADNLKCTTCHGGNPNGEDLASSHVPPPPQIGDREYQDNNATAYFNRLTLTGIDKFPDYQVGGSTYTAIDYLQFVNPGDLRVVTNSRSCGQCHAGHVDCVADSLLATAAGIFSGASYAIGIENSVPESVDDYGDTAADLGFRAVTNPTFDEGTAPVGGVSQLLEYPIISVRNANGPIDLHAHPELYDANVLAAGQNADGTVITDSPLARLYQEQVAFTCGDCHLGSAGANNRYGDYRSSGCTSCHMQYSRDGRSRISDPNVRKDEPADPDDIDDPERPHVERHMIRSVHKTLPSGEEIQGINDYACAGCHQGSNRTVMQYWGIRLDQNQDVRRNFQYPANPDSYRSTRDDPRLFDPVVGNTEFNGRNRNQYLLEEDYDGDGRDDTPPDVHYEAGLGCIDCHGSFDLHGGDTTAPVSNQILSRMDQAVAIRCESCHGAADAYAPTVTGTMFNGDVGQVAVDSKGNNLPHVVLEGDGNYYLYSKLTGVKHYVSQTKDTVVDAGKFDPFSGDPVYSEMASYAMGTADGLTSTGIGPLQPGTPSGFSHADSSVSCATCHASWTNSCIGCHLVGEYDTGNNFSNITGQRIVFKEDEAQFVYQSPIPFHLGIGPNNKIVPIAGNTEMFFQWEDKENDLSPIFAFSDRNGQGNNQLTTDHPSLSHNAMMPHSIRGRVTAQDEGPRYCVACHLTTEGLTNYGTEYATLQSAMQSPTLSGLTESFFDVMRDHIGKNPGNQMNSPLWVHMVAGLGTGLFLFDENGCAINSLDTNDDRYGCEDVAPADIPLDLSRTRYNLDRIVDEAGVPTGSNNHVLLENTGPSLRVGTADPEFAGPLTGPLIQRLTNSNPAIGIVLDAWVDANGQPNAALQAILDAL